MKLLMDINKIRDNQGVAGCRLPWVTLGVTGGLGVARGLGVTGGLGVAGVLGVALGCGCSRGSQVVSQVALGCWG
jgi:hypothetical protein